MILEAFALLATKPVHEPAVLRVYHRHGYQHVHANAKGRHTGEQAKNQRDRSGELHSNS